MKIAEVVLSPEEAFREDLFPAILYRKLSLPADGSVTVYPLRRSIDARSRSVRVRVQCRILEAGEAIAPVMPSKDYPDRSGAGPVIIVGSGPAGLFAAIRLLEMGYRPVILERGKDVRERRRDLAAINKSHVVNPESNYCFGEGGAGTYSDGKLYTPSGKRGDVRRILEILTVHGAGADILFDAHPHIGTNKLPGIITSIRNCIREAGGTVLFGQKVVDLVIRDGRATGVVTASGDRFDGEAVILATGHSARDVFEMLRSKNILMEAKPFALGVRVEHPQELIDRIQYHCPTERGPYLPASSYSLVHQVEHQGYRRGVFSFCMCPGGFIVPAATMPGEVVVNGMSPSRRDSRFANSGIVVSVDIRDFQTAGKDPLAGVSFQGDIERAACRSAGGNQTAPAQRLSDFTDGIVSSTLPDTSYQPGVATADMRTILPSFIADALREAVVSFGSRMKGFLTNEAQIVAVESRTSSPVRIPRDKETLMHPQVRGLFPCGEGAGYAGGIVSAAIDGERCAEAFVYQSKQKKV